MKIKICEVLALVCLSLPALCQQVVGPLTVQGPLTAKSVNGAINPRQYSGSDVGAQINAAVSANCSGGNPCYVQLPSGIAAPLSFSTTVNFVDNMTLDCGAKSGSDTTQVSLAYTGSTVGLKMDGVGGVTIRNCGFDLGTSTGTMISAGGQTQTFDNLYFTGGAAGSTWLKITKSTAGDNSHTTIINNVHGTNLKGDGIFVDHSIDTYLNNIDIYGYAVGGASNLTSRTLVIESGTGGFHITSFNQGFAGLHGLVVADTVDPGHFPQWLFIDKLTTDCPAGGAGWLFDSSLNGNQIGATFTDSWSGGAGLNCSDSSVVTANAPGVLFEGGRDITITSGKFRANTGCAFKLNHNAVGRVTITDNHIFGNNVSNDSNGDGICVTQSLWGLDIGDNVITNVDETGATGHQKYGIGFFDALGTYHNIIIHDNDLSGNDTGSIRYNSANGAPVTAKWGNTNDLNPEEAMGNGNIGALVPGNSGAILAASYGADNSFRAGATANLRFDGSNWYLQSDGANNGGGGMLCANTGTCGLFSVATNGTPTSDQTLNDAALTGLKVAGWDTSTFTISLPTTVDDLSVTSLAGGGTECLQKDVFGHISGTGAECGTGGGGGSVTGVGATSPVASSGGTSPNISLHNSAGSNVTASLGTDTKIFTASGSAAVNGNVITGDAQGGIADSGKAAPSGGFFGTTDTETATFGGTGQNSSAWTGIPKVSSGTWSALTGTTAQTPIYNASGVPIAATPIHVNGSIWLVGNDSTDNYANMVTAISAAASIASNGPVFLDLPMTGLTKITTGDVNGVAINLPSNVILNCAGTAGGNKLPSNTANCGLDITTAGAQTMPLITGWQRGVAGLTNMYVKTSTNRLFMQYTCATPWLERVMFVGQISAKTKVGGLACADGGAGVCPTNDGVQFGYPGTTGSVCSANVDGFDGYGQGVLRDVYFENMRRWLLFYDNANGMEVQNARGDYTDADVDTSVGSAIYMDGQTNSTYGNRFMGIQAEMSNNSSGNCNYVKGIFRLNRQANGNILDVNVSDLGNCDYDGKIGDVGVTSSANNDVRVAGSSGDVGCVDDISPNGANSILCLNDKSYTIRDMNPVHLGRKIALNDMRMSIGYPISSLEGASSGKGTMAWVTDSVDGTCGFTSLIFTQVTVVGSNATYSYSSFTGHAPVVGMSLTVTGFGTSGNNVTLQTITAVSPGVSVTVTTTTQANETHSGAGSAYGGGTIDVICFDTGSGWVPITNLASPTLTSPNIGAATGVSLSVNSTLTAGSSLRLTAKTFATLDSSPVDGEMQFCSDCKVTTISTCSAASPGSCICVGSGTGAFAKRMNYAGGGDNWYCQ